MSEEYIIPIVDDSDDEGYTLDLPAICAMTCPNCHDDDCIIAIEETFNLTTNSFKAYCSACRGKKKGNWVGEIRVLTRTYWLRGEKHYNQWYDLYNKYGTRVWKDWYDREDDGEDD